MDDRRALRRAYETASAPHERYRVSTPLSYLERTARTRPESVAVVDETGSYTYRELEAMSERVGSALLKARAALAEALLQWRLAHFRLRAAMGTGNAAGGELPPRPVDEKVRQELWTLLKKN